MSSPGERWDGIYAARNPDLPVAADILKLFGYLLPKSGRALDLACGVGANSIYMAQTGLIVDAWDASVVGLKQLEQHAGNLPITTRVVEITPPDLPTSTYDVILITRYLDRTLFGSIENALKPGGVLFYQTFTQNKLPTARTPSNPAYLLHENELLTAFGNLNVCAYLESGGLGDTTIGVRNEALFIGQKR